MTPPASTAELLARAHALTAVSVGELAKHWQIPLPDDIRRSKGWMGQLLETVLGAHSGNKPQPDFAHLGIELKTIPVTPAGQPLGSTFICSAPLTNTLGLTWHDSVVYQKLKKILWIPIITAPKTPDLAERMIGRAQLWQPTAAEAQQLEQDWEELMEMITLGRLAQITAVHGNYLQLRPKAADARTLCKGIGEQGEPILTLPRGFYLRAQFTAKILRCD